MRQGLFVTVPDSSLQPVALLFDYTSCLHRQYIKRQELQHQ